LLNLEEQSMDHNPYLKPWRAPQPNYVAGKGEIDKPGQVPNFVWQTRSSAPTEYENQLGDALETVFTAGVETLPEVVAKLNEIGMLSPDGGQWTEASFQAEMHRLALK